MDTLSFTVYSVVCMSECGYRGYVWGWKYRQACIFYMDSCKQIIIYIWIIMYNGTFTSTKEVMDFGVFFCLTVNFHWWKGGLRNIFISKYIYLYYTYTYIIIFWSRCKSQGRSIFYFLICKTLKIRSSLRLPIPTIIKIK